jgi:hypothetical protein
VLFSDESFFPHHAKYRTLGCSMFELTTNEAMERYCSDSAADPPDSAVPRKISSLVQDRIRALKIQNDGNISPSRNDNPLSQVLMAGAASKPKPSFEMQLPSSPTSETAQLLKAANVIRKSFDSETEMFSRRGAGSAHSNSPKGGKPDESTALKDDGSRSVDRGAGVSSVFHQRGGNATIGTVSYAVPAVSTNSQLGRLTSDAQSQSEVSEMPSPPDIFRTVKTESSMDHAVVDDGNENKNDQASGDSNTSRSIAVERFNEAEFTPSKLDTDDPNDQCQTLGKPYRAYARRSRLRSPRVMMTSPDHCVDSVDGTQSVMSNQSSSSQVPTPTLSSRAKRFLKDKKEKRKGAAVVTTGAGGGSKQAIKPNSASAGATAGAVTNIEQDEGVLRLKNDSLSNELGAIRTTVGRPQTIFLKPAVPKKSDHFSDLNRDVDDQQQFQTPSLSRNEHQGKLASGKFIQTSPKTESRENPKKGKDRLHQDAASMDESSYREVKAKYLVDVREEMSATSLLDNHSELDVDASPRGGGRSFDNSCQAFDLINTLPLIESACNALNLGSDAFQNVVFGNRSRGSNTFCADAPSDEDVAIEVEYVEQIEEQQSHAETDSIYSDSLYSGSVRSEST